MIKKSLYFDQKFLRIRSISMLNKLGFICKKYIAVLRLSILKKARLRTSGIDMFFMDTSGLGTTQSNIVDFYHDIVASGIITKKNPFVLDIGANIGQFSNAVKFFYPSASIYSYEPEPNIFKQLERNVSSLNNVRAFNFGLGDKNEDLTFYVHDLSLMSSFKKYDGHEYDRNHQIYLPVRKLDDLVSSSKKIDLVKIDVEGFELNVLKGAMNTLRRSTYLLLEFSLGRDQASGSNLALFSYILKSFPNAKILKFGRPLGDTNRPTCQDVLIQLNQKPI